MDCEQFDDKDKAFIKDALDSVDVPYGERVIIKKYTGISDPGDPARGIQPKLGFTNIPTRAIIDSVTAQDIMHSGGLYQTGDIKVNMKERLNIIDTIAQPGGTSQGDRLIYEGHEYRVVGKFNSQVLIDSTRLYVYTMRKIGNS